MPANKPLEVSRMPETLAKLLEQIMTEGTHRRGFSLEEVARYVCARFFETNSEGFLLPPHIENGEAAIKKFFKEENKKNKEGKEYVWHNEKLNQKRGTARVPEARKLHAFLSRAAASAHSGSIPKHERKLKEAANSQNLLGDFELSSLRGEPGSYIDILLTILHEKNFFGEFIGFLVEQGHEESFIVNILNAVKLDGSISQEQAFIESLYSFFSNKNPDKDFLHTEAEKKIYKEFETAAQEMFSHLMLGESVSSISSKPSSQESDVSSEENEDKSTDFVNMQALPVLGEKEKKDLFKQNNYLESKNQEMRLEIEGLDIETQDALGQLKETKDTLIQLKETQDELQEKVQYIEALQREVISLRDNSEKAPKRSQGGENELLMRERKIEELQRVIQNELRENNVLRRRIENLEREVEEREKKPQDELNSEMDILKSQLVAARGELGSAQENFHKEIDESQKELRAALSEKNDLESQLNDSEKRNSLLLNEKDTMLKDLYEQKYSLEQKNKELILQNKNLKDLKGEKSSHLDMLRDAQKAADDLDKKIEKMEKEKTALQDENKEMKSTVKGLKERIDFSGEIAEQRDKEIEDLKNQLDNVSQELAEKDAQLVSLNQEESLRREEILRREESLRREEDLKSETKRLHKEIKELRIALEKNQEEMLEVSQAKGVSLGSELIKEIDTLKNQLNLEEEKVARAQREQQVSDKEKKDLSKELSEKNNKIKGLENSIENVSRQLKEAAEASKEKSKNIDALGKEMAALRTDITKALVAARKAKEEAKGEEELRNNLIKNTKILQDREKELQESLEGSVVENRALSEELLERNKKIEDLKNSIENASRQLKEAAAASKEKSQNIDALGKEMAALRTNITKAKEGAEELRDNLIKNTKILQDREKELRESLEGSVVENRALSEELLERNKKIEGLENSIENVSRQLKEAAAASTEKSQNIDALGKEMAALRANITKAKEGAEELRDNLIKNTKILQDREKELRKSLEESAAENKAMKKEKEAFLKEASANNKKIEGLEKFIENESMKLQKAVEMSEKTKVTLREKEDKISVLHEEIKGLEKDLDGTIKQYSHEVGDLMGEVENLKRDANDLRSESDRDKSKIADLVREAGIFSGSLQTKEQELENLNRTLEEKNSENNVLKEEIESLQMQLEATRQRGLFFQTRSGVTYRDQASGPDYEQDVNERSDTTSSFDESSFDGSEGDDLHRSNAGAFTGGGSGRARPPVGVRTPSVASLENVDNEYSSDDGSDTHSEMSESEHSYDLGSRRSSIPGVEDAESDRDRVSDTDLYAENWAPYDPSTRGENVDTDDRRDYLSDTASRLNNLPAVPSHTPRHPSNTGIPPTVPPRPSNSGTPAAGRGRTTPAVPPRPGGGVESEDRTPSVPRSEDPHFDTSFSDGAESDDSYDLDARRDSLPRGEEVDYTENWPDESNGVPPRPSNNGTPSANRDRIAPAVPPRSDRDVVPAVDRDRGTRPTVPPRPDRGVVNEDGAPSVPRREDLDFDSSFFDGAESDYLDEVFLPAADRDRGASPTVPPRPGRGVVNEDRAPSVPRSEDPHFDTSFSDGAESDDSYDLDARRDSLPRGEEVDYTENWPDESNGVPPRPSNNGTPSANRDRIAPAVPPRSDRDVVPAVDRDRGTRPTVPPRPDRGVVNEDGAPFVPRREDPDFDSSFFDGAESGYLDEALLPAADRDRGIRPTVPPRPSNSGTPSANRGRIAPAVPPLFDRDVVNEDRASSVTSSEDADNDNRRVGGFDNDHRDDGSDTDSNTGRLIPPRPSNNGTPSANRDRIAPAVPPRSDRDVVPAADRDRGTRPTVPPRPDRGVVREDRTPSVPRTEDPYFDRSFSDGAESDYLDEALLPAVDRDRGTPPAVPPRPGRGVVNEDRAPSVPRSESSGNADRSVEDIDNNRLNDDGSDVHSNTGRLISPRGIRTPSVASSEDADNNRRNDDGSDTYSYTENWPSRDRGTPPAVPPRPGNSGSPSASRGRATPPAVPPRPVGGFDDDEDTGGGRARPPVGVTPPPIPPRPVGGFGDDEDTGGGRARPPVGVTPPPIPPRPVGGFGYDGDTDGGRATPPDGDRTPPPIPPRPVGGFDGGGDDVDSGTAAPVMTATAPSRRRVARKIHWEVIREAIEQEYEHHNNTPFYSGGRVIAADLEVLFDEEGNDYGVTAKGNIGGKIGFDYSIEETNDAGIQMSCTKVLEDIQDVHKQAELLLIAFMEQGKETKCTHLAITTTDARLAAALEEYALAIHEKRPDLIASVVNKNVASSKMPSKDCPTKKQKDDFRDGYLKIKRDLRSGLPKPKG